MTRPDLTILAGSFAPCSALAMRLIPFILEADLDIAHGIDHLIRVWRNVVAIQAREGGDLSVLCAATILHDCVPVSKTSPHRSSASRLAAERASEILADLGWTASRIAQVHHAVLSHSFSAAIPPETLEARVLQDADRIDALGAAGIARCLMLSGQIGRPLYDPLDPAARNRAIDPPAWTIDYIRVSLLTYAEKMTTETGRSLARSRHNRLAGFVDALIEEVEDPALMALETALPLGDRRISELA